MTNATDLQESPLQIARRWLVDFASRVGAEPTTTLDLFVPHAWWRDLLLFTWDLRTFHGAEIIDDRLRVAAGARTPSFRLRVGADPMLVKMGEQSWIQAEFDIETGVACGRGNVRLVEGRETPGGWRAWTLFTMMTELKGHEEASRARRPLGRGDANLNWLQARRKTVEFEEQEPAVVIVGAGHSGLGLAARLGALGVSTLVIESNDRIGDNWRKRYRSLVLHDPVYYDHMPYLQFPPNWPVYTPKDKMGDWLEIYAVAMELNVWCGAQMLEASYDDQNGRWALLVSRNGRQRTLRPRHLVLATGISGTEPFVPAVADRQLFNGTACHSSQFGGGEGWAGKRAIVVGCGNSGHDIAQDLCEQGAEVTMVQRSRTCVVNVSTIAASLTGTYSEDGPPVEEVDVQMASLPTNAAIPMMQSGAAAMALADREMHSGLIQAGFELGFGEDGTGLPLLFLRDGGGYYLNVGASDLIIEGKIAIKHGVEVVGFSPDGVIYDDGSSQPAELVVFATGFLGMADTARRLLGEDLTRHCGPVWGLDEEGELRSVWRRSGQDGLWCTGGNLALSRFYSRFLALQIKAIEVGLLGHAASTRTRQKAGPTWNMT